MKHVPNLLSAARVLAAPYVFYLVWTHQWVATLVWVVVIGITDSLDGYLARRFDAQSRLGAFLDPVADKLLLSGCYLTMGLDGTVPAWLVWFVLGRDAAILLFALGMLLFTQQRRDFPPTRAGKLSTFFQGLYILGNVAAASGLVPTATPLVLSAAVLVVTGWSAVDYARRGAKILGAQP